MTKVSMAKKTQNGREPTRISEKRRVNTSKRRSAVWATYSLPFRRQNLVVGTVSFALILLGFLLLGLHSLTLAPLLMVVGYCFGIPLALLWNQEGGDASGTELKSVAVETEQVLEQP